MKGVGLRVFGFLNKGLVSVALGRICSLSPGAQGPQMVSGGSWRKKFTPNLFTRINKVPHEMEAGQIFFVWVVLFGHKGSFVTPPATIGKTP